MPIPQRGTKHSSEFRVSRDLVARFAEFSGDRNPLHVVEESARAYGFPRPVAHGALVLAEISRIIGMELPGAGALWSDLEIRFGSPVFWDDRLRIEVEVLQSSAAAGMLKLGITAERDGQVVLEGTARVSLLEPLPRRRPMVDLTKQTAVVTGGSRGVGMAIAQRLLDAGLRVVILSRRSSAEVEALCQEVGPERAGFFAADVSDREAVAQAVAESRQSLGPSSICIHAATGAVGESHLDAALDEQLDAHWRVHVHGLVNVVEACVGHMKKIEYGRIVTIGSSYILGAAPPGQMAYVVVKEAAWGLTKALASELAPYGVTANMVSPSMMVTDLTAGVSNRTKRLEAARSPVGRLAEPEEVAESVLFLLGSGGGYINAANLPLTGGGP